MELNSHGPEGLTSWKKPPWVKNEFPPGTNEHLAFRVPGFGPRSSSPVRKLVPSPAPTWIQASALLYPGDPPPWPTCLPPPGPQSGVTSP